MPAVGAGLKLKESRGRRGSSSRVRTWGILHEVAAGSCVLWDGPRIDPFGASRSRLINEAQKRRLETSV